MKVNKRNEQEEKTRKRDRKMEKKQKYYERDEIFLREEERRRGGIEVQGQEQDEEIRKSKYNKYEMIPTPWLLKYMKKKWREREFKVIVRFRCADQERGNRFW